MNRRSHKSRNSRKSPPVVKKSFVQKRKIPRTQPIVSRDVSDRKYPSRASSTMSLTDLQHMAKIHGIPFGGLKKTQLAEKINFYNK